MQWITLAGYIDYPTAVHLMENQVDAIVQDRANEVVLLLQHQEIYTAGTNYHPSEILVTDSRIPIVYTKRGGKITYHGPGQRIIYPILNLALANRHKDIKLYVQSLERWIILTLAHIGIKSYAIDGKTGIWVDEDGIPAKIGAIGVRIRKWVTYHGIAVNINTDLSKYSNIIPCGIRDFAVTSIEKIGLRISLAQFDFVLQQEFNKVFC